MKISSSGKNDIQPDSRGLSSLCRLTLAFRHSRSLLCLFFRLLFPQRTRNPRRKSDVFHLRFAQWRSSARPISLQINPCYRFPPFILLFFFPSSCSSFAFSSFSLAFLDEKTIALKIPFETPLGNATPFIETL